MTTQLSSFLSCYPTINHRQACVQSESVKTFSWFHITMRTALAVMEVDR